MCTPSVLRRLYWEGRRGVGPALPAAILDPVAALHQARVTGSHVMEAAALHPRTAGLIVAAVVAVVTVVAVTRPVSIRVIPRPAPLGPSRRRP